MYKAVFLDRDGVVNDNIKPVNTSKDLILYPWTSYAIKLLNSRKYEVFIVTNQGGIEMGYFKDDDLNKIHKTLIEMIRSSGGRIKDIEYCPHFKSQCNCRKPLPGMIIKLAKKYDIDLQNSFMIGDRDVDIIAGIKAGCKTIKIGDPFERADYTAENLLQAAEKILDLTKN